MIWRAFNGHCDTLLPRNRAFAFSSARLAGFFSHFIVPHTRPFFDGRHKAKSTNVSATGNDGAAGNGLLPGRVSNVTSAQAHARESRVECQAHKHVHDTHTRATVSQNVRMPAASAACASSQMSVKNKTCSGGTPMAAAIFA